MNNVSMQDIARVTGVSKNSVSIALSDKKGLSPATRKRVREVAARLGYQKNPTVAHLMAQLSKSRTVTWKAKLALINANRDPRAFSAHPTIPIYVAGCEQRARRLGYSFDRFWLHDSSLNADAWERILRTRGIVGILIVGLMDSNLLPAHLAALWEKFPTVVTGVRTRNPALSFSCVDHHHVALSAFERALALGYRRPGLVIDDVIDKLVERRFSAGFLTGQRQLARPQRVPIFDKMAPAKNQLGAFESWLNRSKPDVIFTLYNVVFDWLALLGRNVPRDVGVIQLEWRAATPEIAGMNQHNHQTGAAAVDMVVSQIHHNEAGSQEFPRATLIGATWVNGKTVCRQTTMHMNSTVI